MYHRACDPNNGDHHVDLFLYPAAPPGRWAVTLSPSCARRDPPRVAGARRLVPAVPGPIRFRDADPTSTTGTIANGRLTIAVGAYDAHSADGTLAPLQQRWSNTR